MTAPDQCCSNSESSCQGAVLRLPHRFRRYGLPKKAPEAGNSSSDLGVTSALFFLFLSAFGFFFSRLL
jgi:hypothetical protein